MVGTAQSPSLAVCGVAEGPMEGSWVSETSLEPTHVVLGVSAASRAGTSLAALFLLQHRFPTS